jgi:hypothetical protein
LTAVKIAVEHIETRRAAASMMIFRYLGRFNPGPADSSFSWASAIAPTIKGVASFGPGYDQRRLVAREQIYVDRENGKLYESRWEDVIAMDPRPNMIHIETWNELFEGTGICETQDFGRQYIDISARMSRRFKFG